MEFAKLRPIPAIASAAIAAIAITTLLVTACGRTDATDFANHTAATVNVGRAPTIGAIDEIFGADGRPATDFSDGDYVQVRRPDDIRPIYNPDFVSAANADLSDDELVIGLSINGEARAYPAGILYIRELVNDEVGGVPVVVSWCPLCYTAMVHDRRIGGTTTVFGNQGALYKGAMTWFDHDTGTIWSQPLGKAIAGPRVGVSLDLIPAQLTTWRRWRRAFPHSRVLSVNQPTLPFKGQRSGTKHVVGVVIGDVAVAWPHTRFSGGEIVTELAGDFAIAVFRDPLTGAMRAVDLRFSDGTLMSRESAPELIAKPEGLRELPVIVASRWGWVRFYGQNTLR